MFLILCIRVLPLLAAFHPSLVADARTASSCIPHLLTLPLNLRHERKRGPQQVRCACRGGTGPGVSPGSGQQGPCPLLAQVLMLQWCCSLWWHLGFLPSVTQLLFLYPGRWMSAGFYLSSRVSQVLRNMARGTAEGLSLAMFGCAFAANLTYGLAILLRAHRM